VALAFTFFVALLVLYHAASQQLGVAFTVASSKVHSAVFFCKIPFNLSFFALQMTLCAHIVSIASLKCDSFAA
jgi:hypothetical protein